MIKSRMQTDGFTPATGQKYKSTLDCVRTVWRTEGVGAFTRGLGPTLIRCGRVVRIIRRSINSCLLSVSFIARLSRMGLHSSASRWLCVSWTSYSHSQTSFRLIQGLIRLRQRSLNGTFWPDVLFGYIATAMTLVEGFVDHPMLPRTISNMLPLDRSLIIYWSIWFTLRI